MPHLHVSLTTPEPPTSARHPSQKPIVALAGSPMTEQDGPVVLVVDDEPEVCGYVRRSLKPLTRQVLEASNGVEALDLIQRMPTLQLVISDIVMPQMDGLALRSAIQTDPALRPIPVLLITGDSLHPRDGPVLMKPFNARTLLAAVRAILSETA